LHVLGAGGGLGGPAHTDVNFGGKKTNLGAAPHDWGFAKKHMLLILNFSTLTFITDARTTMPFARLHSQLVCTQSEPAEIPQHMFVQILVQVGGDRKRRTLSSTVINCNQDPVSGQACNPPDPH